VKNGNIRKCESYFLNENGKEREGREDFFEKIFKKRRKEKGNFGRKKEVL